MVVSTSMTSASAIAVMSASSTKDASMSSCVNCCFCRCYLHVMVDRESSKAAMSASSTKDASLSSCVNCFCCCCGVCKTTCYG
jgi:hypothetical protein